MQDAQTSTRDGIHQHQLRGSSGAKCAVNGYRQREPGDGGTTHRTQGGDQGCAAACNLRGVRGGCGGAPGPRGNDPSPRGTSCKKF